MKSFFQRFESNRIITHKLNHTNGELALFRLQGDVRQRVQKHFRERFLREGDCLTNGGSISPSAMLALVAGSGTALASSSWFASSLYIASASKASLMAIGSGVGSAVMGTSGIVAQAPFYAASSTILPVVAPVVLLQAITTGVILNQLKALGKTLDDLKKSISRLLHRSEADHAAVLISADQRIAELETDFLAINRFTPSMATRLAILEDRINPLFERFHFLHQNIAISPSLPSDDLGLKQHDAAMTIEASILDLRLDLLRLRLATQEDISLATSSRERLMDKIQTYESLWSEIVKDPDRIQIAAKQLKATTDQMGWFKKNIPSALGGDRSSRIQNETNASAFEIAADHQRIHLQDQVKDAQRTSSAIFDRLDRSEAGDVNLVYWRDDLGEHSYYTSDLQIAGAGQRRAA